jgi:AAA15 family ATPase/GTPase
LITKITTIKEYGVFHDFNWDSTIRDKGNNIGAFKKLNILYGHNYSGKTTLSRIFRTFEKGCMHALEIPKIPKVATYVLERIKNKDREQFDALLESIGEHRE